MSEAQHQLDTSGMNCPLPILKTKKAMTAMASGEVIQVTSTDPGSVKDLDAFCAQTGHQMLSNQETGGKFVFQIQKA
jgi:tRNA 2-thiouridine synthesizing protein A